MAQRLVGKWLPEEMFLELFAVGGCLPGPTSTQVSFALGTVKKGVFGTFLHTGNATHSHLVIYFDYIHIHAPK